jgi:hypothetical protein
MLAPFESERPPMILAALILAGTGPCADRSACPTRAEVERAIHDQQYDIAWQLNREANPPGSDELVMISMVRIVRISGVRCDRPVGEPPVVTCRADLVYYNKHHSVATVPLIRGPEGWKLKEDGPDPSPPR